MTNILIVEDEKAIADLLEVYLKNEKYNVIKYAKALKAYGIKNRLGYIRCYDA